MAISIKWDNASKHNNTNEHTRHWDVEFFLLTVNIINNMIILDT